jgi:hypothetical protein
MASYDSPGFAEQLPGLVFGRDPAMTAPGSSSPGAIPDTDSAGVSAEAGTVGNSALVVPNFGSVVNGDRVTVSPDDVLVSTQALSYGPAVDPLTGIGAALGDTGAGSGHVQAPGNPNVVGVPPMGSQVAQARRPS